MTMIEYDKLVTEVFVSECIDELTGCLQGLPDPRASFDDGKIDYVVPDGPRRRLGTAAKSIAVRALDLYACQVRASIEAEVRASLSKRLQG